MAKVVAKDMVGVKDKDDVKVPLVRRPPPCSAKILQDINQESLTLIMKHYFKVSELELKLVDNEGAFTGFNDQFQSDIKKWRVQVNYQNTTRTFTIMIKVPLTTFFARMGSKTGRQLFSETFWYKYAHPVLKEQFPELASISPALYYAYSNLEDSFRPRCTDKFCCALCGWMCRKSEKGLLLMENVCEETRPTGFPVMVTLDKTKVMSLGHVNAALKTLGQFHGSWWLWLHQQKDKNNSGPMNYQDVNTAFYEMRKMPVVMFKDFLKPNYKVLKAILASQNRAELLAKVREWWRHQFDNDLKVILADTSSDESLVKTICHGDFWNNNIMFSSEDEDEPGLSVTVIDYQGLAFRHPAGDIWYFLHTSTDKAFRDAHLKDCLKTYFEVFSQYILKQNEVKITFDGFLAELNARRSVMALVWAPWVAFITQNPEKTAFGTFSDVKELSRLMMEKLGAAPSKDDHPFIAKIRQNWLDNVEELVAAGCL